MAKVQLGPYPNGVDIAGAIADTKERLRREEEQRIADSGRICLLAADMAGCIYESGRSGSRLAQMLREHFPSTPRGDVYLAIGLAVALFQADLTIAEMELDILRQGASA